MRKNVSSRHGLAGIEYGRTVVVSMFCCAAGCYLPHHFLDTTTPPGQTLTIPGLELPANTERRGIK
jgi:hypothetical protein